MAHKQISHYKCALILGLAFTLGACGIESAGSSLTPDSGLTQSASLPDRLSDEEEKILADPACFLADERFHSSIVEIISRHNRVVASADNLSLLTAAHPDSPDGISVRVCDDEKVYAYSYSKTVILHTGLLETLMASAEDETVDSAGRSELFDSAIAFVLYHELGHIQLGHARSYIIGLGATANPLPEIEADTFSAMLMRQTGYSLEGADLVFTVLSRINPGGSVAHPPSWERMERLKRISDNS